MGIEGPKPKPAHLKVLQGNPGKRRIKREVQPDRSALPDPPSVLTPLARAEWNRISSELYRLGLLTAVDTHPFAAYCEAYGRWVEAQMAIAKLANEGAENRGLTIRTSNGNLIQNPLVGVSNKAAADMVRYAAEFGLTPSARARLASGPKNDAPRSRLEELLAS